MVKIKIETEFIKLGQFLKFSGVVSMGCECKDFIENNCIKVNSNIEKQRGKKLFPGDLIEINGEKYYKTFNEYYKEKALDILNMAKKLHNDGQLTDYVLSVVSRAIENFDRIFYLPITEASLIHGDYNMWNVLIDKKNCKVTAIIDPCGCMWADSEYDLYQLNNANGKHLKLFETYANKKTLSENCSQKMAFYELFTEIEHYHNSGYPVIQKLIKKQADNLKEYLA